MPSTPPAIALPFEGEAGGAGASATMRPGTYVTGTWSGVGAGGVYGAGSGFADE